MAKRFSEPRPPRSSGKSRKEKKLKGVTASKTFGWSHYLYITFFAGCILIGGVVFTYFGRIHPAQLSLAEAITRGVESCESNMEIIEKVV